MNEDLNNLTEPGTYYSKNDATTKSLTNCPLTTLGFTMTVNYSTGNDSSYICQTIYGRTTSFLPIRYVRYKSGSKTFGNIVYYDANTEKNTISNRANAIKYVFDNYANKATTYTNFIIRYDGNFYFSYKIMRNGVTGSSDILEYSAASDEVNIWSINHSTGSASIAKTFSDDATVLTDAKIDSLQTSAKSIVPAINEIGGNSPDANTLGAYNKIKDELWETWDSGIINTLIIAGGSSIYIIGYKHTNPNFGAFIIMSYFAKRPAYAYISSGTWHRPVSI